MSRAFNTIPAKPTFGTLKQQLYQSDYIQRKKAVANIATERCKKLTNKLIYNPFASNKTNLVSRQYSKMDLNNVCTVSTISINPMTCNPEPVIIDTESIIPFNETYTTDPLGELFGNTPCGELNYTYYSTHFNPKK